MEHFETKPEPRRRGRPPKNAGVPKAEQLPIENMQEQPKEQPKESPKEPSKVEYESYSIKRAGKKKSKVFSFIVIGVALVLVIFVANLLLNNALFGMFKASTNNGGIVTLDGFTFWAVEVDQFDNKGKALECSRDVIKQGGAGYVLGEEGKPYSVLCCVYCSKAECDAEWNTLDDKVMPNARVREFAVSGREVTLSCCHDTELFTSLVNSFRLNFKELCSRSEDLRKSKTTAKEISNWALFTYNSLQQQSLEFSKVQENAKNVFYAKVLTQVNKQLLAVYQLAYEGDSSNYLSVLNNTMCAVAFSYSELLAA